VTKVWKQCDFLNATIVDTHQIERSVNLLLTFAYIYGQLELRLCEDETTGTP